MPYIAKQPGTAFRTFTDKDTFTGDGSTTTFDMQFAIAEAGQNDLQIFVGSTRQIPGTDYTLGVDGSSEYKRITFTSAPADSSTITVLNPGTVQGEFSSVADNAVTSGKLNVDAITGQTELAEAAANNDTLLIHDTSASALKKIQVQNLTAQAGDGLSKTNSTLAVDIPNTTLLDAGAATNDELLIYDTSANALKSITQVNLLNFPSISSVSPTNATSGDGTGNFTFTITGSGFTGSTASLVNSSSQTVSFDSQTVDSDTQITGVIAKSSLPNSGEPYDVRVTAATGLQSTLEDQINVDANPVWSTAAGSIATIFDGQRASYGNITVAAADPESGGDITYTLESGSLPSGMSGTSTSSGYVISGTANAVGTNTTSTFTIRAKDVNSNTADRQFTITVYAPVVTSFTSSGTFTVPTGLTSVDVLVVAGGGAGGGDNGGGGGAGGLIYRPGFPITPGTPISVTVGDGGPEPGQTAHGAIPGSDTVFSTLTAKGGGGGGGQANAGGGQGGSGGGGNGHQGYPGNDFGNGTQPNQPGDSGNYGFGNDGASGQPSAFFGGGGGGAGGGATSYVNGGSSKSYSISGTSVAYAGGGGGGSNGLGGGSGGGGGAGQGSNTTGNPATANRGSGGGGGGNANPRPGGSGGKGIVIVSY